MTRRDDENWPSHVDSVASRFRVRWSTHLSHDNSEPRIAIFAIEDMETPIGTIPAWGSGALKGETMKDVAARLEAWLIENGHGARDSQPS